MEKEIYIVAIEIEFEGIYGPSIEVYETKQDAEVRLKELQRDLEDIETEYAVMLIRTLM